MSWIVALRIEIEVIRLWDVIGRVGDRVSSLSGEVDSTVYKVGSVAHACCQSEC